MSPNINDGDWLIIWKYNYINRINRYDIIVFNGLKNQKMLKRIKSINNNNQYYVIGDNSLNSVDSRKFGLINNSEVIGKAILRYYPIKKIKKI